MSLFDYKNKVFNYNWKYVINSNLSNDKIFSINNLHEVQILWSLCDYTFQKQINIFSLIFLLQPFKPPEQNQEYPELSSDDD